MAETGGTLLPTTPPFRIDAQMGGVKFDPTGISGEQFTMEVGDRLVDAYRDKDTGIVYKVFDNLFTIRDASGVYKQYNIKDGTLHGQFTKDEFKTLLDEKIKEKKIPDGPRRAIYIQADIIKDAFPKVESSKNEVEETIYNSSSTNQTQPETSTEKKQINVQTKPATSSTETQTNTPNNTIGISANVKEELRKILKDDAKLNEAIKLLNETEPGKLRSNIIFNPDYKPVAELIKEIVAFKIKQYADKMAELEKGVDVVPGETLEATVTAISETEPVKQDNSNPPQSPIVSTLEANVASTSEKETSETLVQNVENISGEKAKSETEETSGPNVATTSENNPNRQQPIISTSAPNLDNTSSVASNETIENGLSNVSSITNNGNVSNIASETSENTSVENIPETNITKVNTSLLNNSEAEAEVKTGGKTKKKKSNLRKLKTMKKRKNK